LIYDALPKLSMDHLPRYKIGDLVMHYIPHTTQAGKSVQLSTHWKGPYRITDVREAESTAEPLYKIQHTYKRDTAMERVHPSRLKHFRVFA
jgi:hypothetical protein